MEPGDVEDIDWEYEQLPELELETDVSDPDTGPDLEPVVSDHEVLPEMEPLKENLPQCCMCSNEASLSCAVCKCSFYCSHECQDADLRTHEVICLQWLIFALSGFAAPPHPSSRRGIFFPAGTDTPKFVWVTTIWIPPKDEDTPGFEQIDFKPFLGEGVVESIRISANAIRSRRREHDHIQLFYRADAVVDGSSRNRTTARLTYHTFEFYPWCGSLLAMRSPIPPESDPEIMYTYMDPGDFRDLVDLFWSYISGCDMNDMNMSPNHKGPDSPLAEGLLAVGASYDEDPAELLYARMNAGTRNTPYVPGVRINCWSDMCGRGKDMFEDVQVPFNDPIWGENAQTTIISELMGTPIRTRRIRPISDNDEANLEAMFLHVDADYPSETWGQPYPQDWQRCAGSVLVVRDEGIAISPMDVKMLCSFCMDFLQPCIEESLEDPGNTQLREEIFRTLVTGSAFGQFCSDFHLIGRGAADLVVESTPGTSTEMNLMIGSRL